MDENIRPGQVMIIVYRLRNNLFHGLKIDMLNDQAASLDIAAGALAGILEASENYLLRTQFDYPTAQPLRGR